MEASGGAMSPGPKRKIIGLTGGIGSGKTTVAKIIEDMGYPVYYSDARAKEIVNENALLKQEIRTLLGEGAYDENGIYNRKFVSGLIFGNNELLGLLNSIIHPAVRIDFEGWISQQLNSIIFKETALLFELNLDDQCDASLLVTADDRLRIKRVMDRDGKTYREVEAIIAVQLPEKDKIKKADYVILNNDSLENLRTETQNVLKEIVAEV